MYRLSEVIFVAVVVCVIAALFGPGPLVATIIFSLVGIFAWCSSRK